MDFNFPYISLTIVGLYALSYWLVKINRLPLITQRRAWIITLGTFFLLTAISGLTLVIQLSYGIYWKLPFDLLFWHVEAGIGFTSVALFHVLWHYRYFLAILKRQ